MNRVEISTREYSLFVESVADLDTAMVWLEQMGVSHVLMSRDGVLEAYVLEFYPQGRDPLVDPAPELRLGDVLVYDLEVEAFKALSKSDFLSIYRNESK